MIVFLVVMQQIRQCLVDNATQAIAQSALVAVPVVRILRVSDSGLLLRRHVLLAEYEVLALAHPLLNLVAQLVVVLEGDVEAVVVTEVVVVGGASQEATFVVGTCRATMVVVMVSMVMVMMVMMVMASTAFRRARSAVLLLAAVVLLAQQLERNGNEGFGAIR